MLCAIFTCVIKNIIEYLFLLKYHTEFIHSSIMTTVPALPLQHMFSFSFSSMPDRLCVSLWRLCSLLRMYKWNISPYPGSAKHFFVRLWPVGLESFVYCLFRSQLDVAIATKARTLICGIARFEDQLQSMLKESIIAWLLSITVGDSCTEWVQNPNYRCLGELRHCYVRAVLSTWPTQISFLTRWYSFIGYIYLIG